MELNEYNINSSSPHGFTVSSTALSALPPDIIRKISLDLTYDEIRRFCRTSKRFENMVCNNNIFWSNKLELDFPNWKRSRFTSGKDATKEYLLQLANVVDKDKAKIHEKFYKLQYKMIYDLHEMEKEQLAFIPYGGRFFPDSKQKRHLASLDKKIAKLKVKLAEYDKQQTHELRALKERADRYREIASEL
jgi:hypothetical protein